jgi:Rrf2 family protein
MKSSETIDLLEIVRVHMLFSTRGRYGARAMLDLALNYGKGPVPLKNVAKRQEISEKYLNQLVMSLKKIGLVRSIRGARGGYVLAKSPAQIKLSEVIRTLEGPVVAVDCLDDPGACNRVSSCALRDIWEKTRQAMDNVLESTALQDLADRQRRKCLRGNKQCFSENRSG